MSGRANKRGGSKYLQTSWNIGSLTMNVIKIHVSLKGGLGLRKRPLAGPKAMLTAQTRKCGGLVLRSAGRRGKVELRS